MEKTLLLRLYSAVMRIASPLLPLYLKRRAKQGKEDPSRLKERFGYSAQARPNGPLIWIHGASVGETLMAVPLIERLLGDNLNLHILITSGTVTSANLLKQRLPPRALHQYVPIDTPQAAARFLNHWRPDLGLSLESEIWPHLILQSKTRDIPLVLLNARLSESSRKGWEVRPKSAKTLFDAFDDILPADRATAQSLSKILGRPCPVFGNLKLTAPPLTADPLELEHIKSQISARPIWCAASTHAGEDELILNAHKALLELRRNALLLLIPRHPERGTDIAHIIDNMALSFTRLNGPVTDAAQVILIDEIGKMGLAYRLADSVVMGGSLHPTLSGHNPYEAAQLDCAVLSGPHVSSFEELYADMSAAGAVKIVTPNAQAIAAHITALWDAPETREVLRQGSKNFTQEQAGKMDAVLTRLAPFISSLNRL